jgi:hypothetical protein
VEGRVVEAPAPVVAVAAATAKTDMACLFRADLGRLDGPDVKATRMSCAAESPCRLPDLTNTTSKNKYLYQMVLHRPVELALNLGNLPPRPPPGVHGLKWWADG